MERKGIWRMPFTKAHMDWALKQRYHRTDGQTVLVITEGAPPFQDARRLQNHETLTAEENAWAQCAAIELLDAQGAGEPKEKRMMSFLERLEEALRGREHEPENGR